MKHDLKSIMGNIVFIINKLHHGRCHNKTSARSTRQLFELIDGCGNLDGDFLTFEGMRAWVVVIVVYLTAASIPNRSKHTYSS
jgi:hypothetical protein